MTKKEIAEIKRGIKWDLRTGRYKNLDELIEDCCLCYLKFGGGGFYGVGFKILIPYLEYLKDEKYKRYEKRKSKIKKKSR